MPSPVWLHFVKDGETAKCKICGNVLKCKQSTSGLIRHLKGKHNITLENSLYSKHSPQNEASSSSSNTEGEPPRKKKRNDLDISLEEIVVDFAIDGVPFRTIANNKHLRRYITMTGNKPPSNARDVAYAIYKKEKELKDNVKQELKVLIENGMKLSLSLDEGSTIRNRKYLNIVIHLPDGGFKNLGVIRVNGSCPAEKLVDLTTEKLEEFSVNLKKDIFAIISDGAKVMIRFAKLIGCEHQICYSHTIHLAVTDVFYMSKAIEVIDYSNDTAEIDENESDIEEENDEEIRFIEDNADVMAYSEAPLISDVLNKCRKIVKLFKLSSKKNTVLQQYIVEHHGKELQLLLDCRTRWNSLIPMLKRIVSTYPSITLALSELNENGLSGGELKMCADIIEVLEPIETLVLALCKRTTNIVGAEIAVECTLNHIKKQNTDLSRKMVAALLNRFGDTRRNMFLTSMANYFHNPEEYGSIKNNILKFLSKHELEKKVFTVLKSLNDVHTSVDHDAAVQDDETSAVPECSLSFADELKLKMQHIHKKKDSGKKSTTLQTIKKDMKYLELTGNLSKELNMIKTSLDCVVPTSVEPERTFSLCDFFVSKRRNRFSDKSINSLIFLKSNFKEN